MLQRNIGDVERLIRVILGIYAMLLGFLFITGLAGNLLGLVGLVLLVTGASGWCGIYTLLGRALPEVAVSEVTEVAGVSEVLEAEFSDEVTDFNAQAPIDQLESEAGMERVSASEMEEDLTAAVDEVLG